MRTFAGVDALRATQGQHIGRSHWMRLDERRLARFVDALAGASGLEALAGSAMIEAPPYLLVALIARFHSDVLSIEGVGYSVNYGCNSVRFGDPVSAGDEICGLCTLESVTDVPGGVQAVSRWTIEKRGSTRPVCIAETVSRYYL